MRLNLAKKGLSTFLTLCMVVGLFAALSVTARAAGNAAQVLSAGNNLTAVIKEDGSLWMAGSNALGQLGDGTGGRPHEKLFGIDLGDKNVFVKIMDGVVAVETSNSFNSCEGYALAIKTDGSLWGWGDNYYGQLGIGVSGGSTAQYPSFQYDEGIDMLSPVKIMENVTTVSAGVRNAFAVKADGTLWGCGRNQYGMLGAATTGDVQSTPVKIMDDVAAVSAGEYHVLVIKTDGSLWGWGANYFGQLAGKTAEETVYSPIKIMDSVSSISAGRHNAFVIKADGSLWAWGYNRSNNGTQSGILGTGSTAEFISAPAKVLDDVAAISTHIGHTLAVKRDGSLWAWGENTVGQIGNGLRSEKTVTSPLKVMDGVATAASGAFHSAAIKTDGTLWTWGNRYAGDLGDGKWKTEPTPISESVYYSPKPAKVMDGVKLPTAVPTASVLTAAPTASTVLVNGESVGFDAYNINGNNYFKLRDLAYILSGTEKQFDVSWDGANNAISLTSGMPYTAVGGEMTGKGSSTKTPTSTASKIYLDGKEVAFTAYNIEGNNYFKLRDIGQAFDFGVDWDGANNTIVIDTGKSYTVE